jgi:AraC-like DNA-binding protein
MTTDQGSVSTVRIETNRMPPARRLAVLQDLFDRSIGMEVAAARGQPVGLQVNAVPGLRRAQMLRPFTAQAARPATRLADGDDTVCLMIKSGGHIALRQGRREAIPEVGDGVLLVYRQPSELRFQDATYLSLRVPLRALAMLIDVEAAAGRRIVRDTSALVLLRQYVASLPERLDDPALGVLVATHVYDLMAMAIGATDHTRELALGRGVRAARLASIKADLARDPTQAIEDIAGRQQVSPRYIQRLLEEDGTSFSEFATERRLDAVRAMLRSPRFEDWSVAGIAFEAGFKDLSHFNRRFRRRFGLTPSEFRRQAFDPPV